MKFFGLSEKEAQEKLTEFGLNEIPQAPATAFWKIFLSQFRSFLVAILVLAAGLSFIIQEVIDGFFILLIVFLNSFLGFYQEQRAQKEMRSLKTLVTPVCRVIRGGQEKLLATKMLVPGDLVVIGAGDKVPADGILVEGERLTVNEAVLTGESVPVEKRKKAGLLMSTTVLSGQGKLLVTATGSNTSFGKIAKTLFLIPEEKTPLEIKLFRFSQTLVVLIITGGVILFSIGFFQNRPLAALFLSIVSLVVAAIPEGLPAVFTITLALGMQRMAKQKALIRKLSATEGLGSVEVICTDKTGTLTKNEMTVRKIWLSNNSSYEITGVGYSSDGEIQELTGPVSRQPHAFPTRGPRVGLPVARHPSLPGEDLKQLIEFGVLCNSSSLVLKEDKGHEFDILGDTTEGALLVLAQKARVDAQKLQEEYEVVEGFTFDNDQMISSITVKRGQEVLFLVKGAPERILEICQMTKKEKELAEEKMQDLAKNGLRVIAVAYKQVEGRKWKVESGKKEENDLTLVGLVGIDDPAREEVRETISLARKAGIRTVMLTGDNPLTALKIAEEVGLAEKGDEVVSGEQLEKFSQEVFGQKLLKVNIFARVSPLQKLKIVRAFQTQGFVTAVTGDGVNDAPALKKADIGVALGKTGTETAKEASDLVILDDNYSTLVKAVEEGRVIYDNITKAIKYLLSSNLGEVLTVAIALVFFPSLPLPLLPTQILWINLVSDGLPALALAVDPKDMALMNRNPRKDLSLLNLKRGRLILVIGIFQALATLLFFLPFYYFWGEKEARLTAFSILVVMEMATVFFIRGRRQIFSNKFLLWAVTITLVLQFLILTIPFLRNIFS